MCAGKTRLPFTLQNYYLQFFVALFFKPNFAHSFRSLSHALLFSPAKVDIMQMLTNANV